jgi:hypothetical protein
MEPVKVVAHFIDDVVVKGYALDFNPTQPSFHLYVGVEGFSPEQAVRLDMKEIKALFFVKTFEGNRQYHERKDFLEGDRALGRRVEVQFIDGEVIRGSTLDYDPARPGFFLIPVDPESNNIQIFVVANAVMNLRHL